MQASCSVLDQLRMQQSRGFVRKLSQGFDGLQAVGVDQASSVKALGMGGFLPARQAGQNRGPARGCRCKVAEQENTTGVGASPKGPHGQKQCLPKGRQCSAHDGGGIGFGKRIHC